MAPVQELSEASHQASARQEVLDLRQCVLLGRPCAMCSLCVLNLKP